jgi:SAM-dependent methyltransferase
MTVLDKSNGYEQIAHDYIVGRGQNVCGIGTSVVTDWCRTLPVRASVLDLGCGNGLPITILLIERSLDVYGIDASPTMIAAFRARFPGVPVQCAAAEDSDFFGKTFDAVIACGLFFLLEESTQLQLIQRIGVTLRPGGKLLFTSPSQKCMWRDAMTDRVCASLGYAAYEKALESSSMRIVESRIDEGENHYYFAQKK